jgi:hypothetical protein
MEHEEFYRGQRIIVTTAPQPNGSWSAKAELVDAGGRSPIGRPSDAQYQTQEDARVAAVSAAAAAIDATRVKKGKP